VAAVCTNEGCGLLAEPARPKNTARGASLHDERPYCRRCRSSDGVCDIKLPYASKLFVQELMACGIALRFHLEGRTSAPAKDQEAQPARAPQQPPSPRESGRTCLTSTAEASVHSIVQCDAQVTIPSLSLSSLTPQPMSAWLPSSRSAPSGAGASGARPPSAAASARGGTTVERVPTAFSGVVVERIYV